MPAPTAQQQASTTAIPTHHPSNMSHHHPAAPQTPAGAAGHPGYQRQSSVSAEAPTAQAHQDSQELSSPSSGGRGGDIRERGSKLNRSGNSATSPTRGRVSSTAGQSPPSDALGKALASVSILQKCLDLYCMRWWSFSTFKNRTKSYYEWYSTLCMVWLCKRHAFIILLLILHISIYTAVLPT